MMKLLSASAVCCALLCAPAAFPLAAETFELSLRDAENEALKVSNRVKSFASEERAAAERADAQFSPLLPRLSLEAGYRYLSEVPVLPSTGVQLNSHSSYSVGPALNYTLWDTGSSRKAYRGFSKLAESLRENRRNAELELLFSVRTAYVRVRLALEELGLVGDSLELSRAQDRDVAVRYRAGASSRLDLVTARREVLNYELEFKRQQAELSAALRDLLAFLDGRGFKDLSHPGLPGTEGVSVALKLDPLQKLLSDETAEILPPDETQPLIRAQRLAAESSDLAAAGLKAGLFPTVQVSAKTSLDYPNGPVFERINQNTVSAFLTMPLFETGRTRHLAGEKTMQAEAARYREKQLSIDLQRDFLKARELLESLRGQRELAARDVRESQELARLYYDSYKAGRTNLIDVQSANVRAFQAKVNAARIDAQTLNQRIALKALSGRETP